MTTDLQKKIILTVLSLLLCLSLHGQNDNIVTWKYKDQTFAEFASEAERTFRIKFFYKDAWVNSIRLGEYKDCNTIACILQNLFEKTDINYIFDKNSNVILTGDFLLKSPGDSIRSELRNLNAPQNIDKGVQDTVYVTIGNAAEKNISGNVVLTGQIYNEATKEPVPAATIYLSKLMLGTTSNKAGYYSISLPRGVHEISISYVGMQNKKIYLSIYRNGVMNIALNGFMIPLKEVVIKDETNTFLGRAETGFEKITISAFNLLPSTPGEADIIKSLLFLPGVKSVGEGSAGFNVRGGSADQNLILMYGAPLFSSSHFLGFFPAVNSNIIQDVTFYKGGMPSRYGGRISSVLDVAAKEGNPRELKGSAGISPVTTDIVLEGPAIPDTLSFLLAGRTTYSNWVFGLVNNPLINESSASFYDINTRLTYSPGRKDKIDLSSYFSDDRSRLISAAEYNYKNRVVALKWRHIFNNFFHASFYLTNSNYRYNTIYNEVPAESYSLSHRIDNNGFKSDFYLTHSRNDINFGFDLNGYSVLPGSIAPVGDSSIIIHDAVRGEKAYDGAVFIEDQFRMTQFISLNIGLRMSAFAAFGPNKVLKYDPGFSRAASTVTDTINFDAGNISRSYSGPEFRGSLNFKVNDKSSLKLNYNRTRQYLHLLSNTMTISPTDTWKLSDYYLKPQIGDQYAAGFYLLVFNQKTELSAEAYYKRIKNMADYKGGTDLTMVNNLEQHLIDTRGKAYGLELSLKKNEGRLLYRMSYTYSRTYLQSIGKFREEIVNSGNWYPANYDKPHDLSITFNYLYSRRLSLSGDLTYSTGRPITYPLSVYRMRNVFLVDYSERNRYRLPNTLRFDVAVKISGNLKINKVAHPSLVLSVYNLLGRENPYSVYFRKEEQLFRGYVLSVFGRPVPSVTFRLDF